MGEKCDYDSENSWISDGLPSSSRRRRRGDVRGIDVRVGLGLSVLSFGIISVCCWELLCAAVSCCELLCPAVSCCELL